MSSKRLRKSEVEFREEKFLIREWTSTERAEFFKRAVASPLGAGAYLSSRCTLKPDGKREWADESGAGEEPAELVEFLTQEITKLSGLDMLKLAEENAKKKQALEDGEEVKEDEKND